MLDLIVLVFHCHCPFGVCFFLSFVYCRIFGGYHRPQTHPARRRSRRVRARGREGVTVLGWRLDDRAKWRVGRREVDDILEDDGNDNERDESALDKEVDNGV
jgi:hypothetical protein